MTIRTAVTSDSLTLVDIWEASVRATHDFLAEDDLQALRPRMLHEWLPAVDVAVFVDARGETLGFMGTSGESLEMLFVAPAARGMGIGRALVEHAIRELAVRVVDVNEQNGQAVGFYRRMGFEVVGRSELDGQGKPYPLLHMRLGG